MKVSVLGAGAIGSMFGGLLQQHSSDLEVLLVTRGEHGETISQRGAIDLAGPWGKQSVAIQNTQDIAAIADSDYVFLTVKSQGTEAAIRAAQPYLGAATIVDRIEVHWPNSGKTDRFTAVGIDRLVECREGSSDILETRWQPVTFVGDEAATDRAGP